MTIVSLQRLQALAERALELAGADHAMAIATARALVAADAQGLTSHGVARVAQYAAHLKNGRANGRAVARIVREKPAACLIDAENGLAFPACGLAVQEAVSRARSLGIGLAAVTNSHHFGVAADHLAKAAEHAMVGVAFSNSPAAMPAWGGKRALFGTNPIAAVFPRTQRDATLDRSIAIGSCARQGDGRGPTGQTDSARMGTRPSRPADDGRKSGARRHDASSRRRQGRDARADRRAAVHRAHRRPFWIRGRFVLC